MKPFTNPLKPEDVEQLVDLTVVDDSSTQSMATMQREGVAALYNILCKHDFAYLADEVGMGKTYQALSLTAIVWNEKPDAHVLFISPRANLQTKWHDDYRRFFSSNYRRPQGLGDDRAVSVLLGTPIHEPMLFENLRSWAPTIGLPQRIAPFLRHTSFTRPVYVTGQDTADVDALWGRTENRLHTWGLFDVRQPPALGPDNASRELNLAFAKALNRKLASESAAGDPFFDLVIVDEAQALRNPLNQTNQVLFSALQGNVRKWLFMSATPAHSGPRDIPTILNHYPRYPGADDVLEPELAEAGDLQPMQSALEAFMVRRQRRYLTAASRTVGKHEYREHDKDRWAIQHNKMSALGTLAMGLVQKELVRLMAGRNNRYRIGFLSSFESLQSSIGRTHPIASEEDGPEAPNASREWEGSHDTESESDAPDSNFVNRLSEDFKDRFGLPLPHPKVDALVEQVAPLAFGTAEISGGRKFLIFTRRVSTVHALRDRLTRRYIESIEDRVQRCWGQQLDWSGSNVGHEGSGEDESDESIRPEDAAVESDEEYESPMRLAMSQARKGWLFRYRQTFRATGRNALFFEDGWLLRLCRAGKQDPQEAASRVPYEIWAESWTAAHSGGARPQQHRAVRVRYLAMQGIDRCPKAFGLSEAQAKPWKAAYSAALHDHIQRVPAAPDPHPVPELFSHPTLWTLWDECFPTGDLALPGADVSDIDGDCGAEALCQRQVARTILGQNLRLTDTLLDLFFADQAASRDDVSAFPRRFVEWLASDDSASRRLRNDCAQWLAHLRLIVDSCLEGAGHDWRHLARSEHWEQLRDLSPVLGVTGGGGAHRRATQQFRTPSLPRVIVCTDTFKEGVDLHLFCDHVLHYGVAWTAGDLEQRVGRVDRYFSQIERRLSTGAPPDVALNVGYPHLEASLERGQVERVIERQRRAEQLMDSPLAGSAGADRELTIDATTRPAAGPQLGPFAPQSFPEAGRDDLVVVSKNDALAIECHYVAWYGALKNLLFREGWRIDPDDAKPVAKASLSRRDGRYVSPPHEIEWSFDPALAHYALTLTNPPLADGDWFSGGKRRRDKVETFVRLLVPSPGDALDNQTIDHFADTLRGVPPRPRPDAAGYWGSAMQQVGEDVEWLTTHKARVTVRRNERTHRITLYAYEGSVRILGIVAPIEALRDAATWGDHPSAEQVRDWAHAKTCTLPLGYLDVHPRDGLVFGIHLLHGRLSEQVRRRLLQEVAWRADMWEAALTGEDRQ